MEHKKIIQQFGGPRRMAREIGQQTETVRKWVTRNRIPAAHWPAVIQAAIRCDVALSYKALAEGWAEAA